MYEIELKAWLDDRKRVSTLLNGIAGYDGIIDKNDVYWSSYPDGKEGRRVTIRIRTEQITKNNTNKKTEYLVTYKKHGKAVSPSGESCEVNVEREFKLPSAEAADTFSTFLEDAGFEISLQKHKATEGWYKDIYHIELCSIDKLGDFIEIETISDDSNPETVKEKRDGILEIIDSCGISRDKIESRSYREMLEATGAEK